MSDQKYDSSLVSLGEINQERQLVQHVSRSYFVGVMKQMRYTSDN